MTDRELKLLLDEESARINSPAFIGDDPVQFPRRFSDKRDIEIIGLLSAMIAWGNRKMICRDCERMLEIMGDDPYHYVMDEGYLNLNPEMNLHRTFFARNFIHFLKGLRSIYSNHDSLDSFAGALKVGETEYPAWELVGAMNREILKANDGVADNRGLPQNLRTTALKRVNMALRWFVRNDGIVDMGVWESIPKSKLFIPLDVHVGNTARELGLIERKANDRKTVELLTSRLREFNPEDPCIYDYALFGLGIESKPQPSKLRVGD
ncbi:MAG: TIGR02757 family protein [Bacteroides sp.]|nr:TIGR02757 family protein [Bacteroides sp.]